MRGGRYSPNIHRHNQYTTSHNSREQTEAIPCSFVNVIATTLSDYDSFILLHWIGVVVGIIESTRNKMLATTKASTNLVWYDMMWYDMLGRAVLFRQATINSMSEVQSHQRESNRQQYWHVIIYPQYWTHLAAPPFLARINQACNCYLSGAQDFKKSPKERAVADSVITSSNAELRIVQKGTDRNQRVLGSYRVLEEIRLKIMEPMRAETR